MCKFAKLQYKIIRVSWTNIYLKKYNPVSVCLKWVYAGSGLLSRTFSVQDWSAYDRTIFAELLRPCIASSTQHQWTFDTSPPCTYRFFVESAIMTYAYKPGIRWLRSMPLSEATLSCCQATLCCQATPRRRAVKPVRVWQLNGLLYLDGLNWRIACTVRTTRSVDVSRCVKKWRNLRVRAKSTQRRRMSLN